MGPKNAPSGDKNHDIFHPDIIIYDIFLMILTRGLNYRRAEGGGSCYSYMVKLQKGRGWGFMI